MSRRFGLLGLIVVLLVPAAMSSPHAAPAAAAVLDASLVAHPAWSGGEPSDAMTVVVALHGPTTLDLYRARHLAVGDTSPKAQRALDEIFAAVTARQAPARAAILAAGARIISTYNSAYNGFLVLASRAQVERFAGAAGVRLVYRAPEWVPTLSKAIPHVGAERALTELGVSGSGVRIAIIDTGIDYYHRSLGGSGREQDFKKDNPDIAEAETFPTDRVVGGYDFAGTLYAAGASQADYREPKPDNDPRDQHYHGTHVAGIAAGGRGVAQVAHGVAPDAQLIALKVFGGIGGGTTLANDAIEWTVQANLGRTIKGYCRRDANNLCRVDVINMSLGSSFANDLPEASEFIRRATEAGIVVVAASGNSGNVSYVTGSPGGSPYALSVANTIPPGRFLDKIVATYDGQDHDVEALESEPTLARQMTGQPDLAGQLVYFGRACPGDPAAGDVKGKVALIDGDETCEAVVKLQAARAGEAIGAVIYNVIDDVTRLSSTTGAVDIPAYAIRLSDGSSLRALLVAGTRVDVRFSAAFRDVIALGADSVAGSSSRGPSRGGAFKPDLAAPGTNIFAPRLGSGKEGIALTGTSMASPIVAGGAALVVERARRDGLAPPDRPLGTGGVVAPLDIAAWLVNTATASAWQGDPSLQNPAPLAWGGVGRMQVDKAIESETIVRAGTIASVNLGYQAFAAAATDEREITIRNLSGAARRYRVETRLRMTDDAGHGVTYAASPDTVAVAAGGSATVAVTAAVEPGQLKAYGVYGGQKLLNGTLGAMTDSEMDGLVVVTEVDDGGTPVRGGDVAHLPVYFLPRAATALSLSRPPVVVDRATGRGTARFPNAGDGGGPIDVFALFDTDLVEGNVDPRLNIDVAGARVVPGDSGGRLVELVVHTSGVRDIPLEAQAQFFLDTDRDGDVDWLVHNADAGLLLTRPPTANGQHVSVARDVTNTNPVTYGRQQHIMFADVDIHSRTMILRVDAARLGFAPGKPVAFDAVVVMVPGIDDVRGGDPKARKGYDALPDDGWTDSNVPGPGRVSFDETVVPAFESWRRTATARSGASTAVGLPAAGASTAPWQMLAVYPLNAPGEGDFETFEVVIGTAPTAPPTVAPTSTLRPTSTPGPSPTEGPTATATLAGETRLIYLPVARR